jgi:hypothetical protein
LSLLKQLSRTCDAARSGLAQNFICEKGDDQGPHLSRRVTYSFIRQLAFEILWKYSVVPVRTFSGRMESTKKTIEQQMNIMLA